MNQTLHPRRLLNIDSVAKKLDCARTTFTRNRQALECIGFPMPCLPEDQFGSERWDEKAIDLWLDARIPAGLTNQKLHMAQLAAQANIAAELQSRARSLSL